MWQIVTWSIIIWSWRTKAGLHRVISKGDFRRGFQMGDFKTWSQSYKRFTSLYLQRFYLYSQGNFTKIWYKSKRLVTTSESVQVSFRTKYETFWPKNFTWPRRELCETFADLGEVLIVSLWSFISTCCILITCTYKKKQAW